MKVVGIIPARYASTRFDGKSLASIEGKPLIRHVYEKAASSRCLSELMVATDDLRIAGEVESFGGNVVMTSSKHTCGSERVAEVAEKIDADVIVNIQGDELLATGEMIDECVSPLADDPSLDVSTLAVRIENEGEYTNPNLVKVVLNLKGDALFFSRSPIPRVPLSSLNDKRFRVNLRLLRHVGMYSFRRAFLLDFVKLSPTPLELAESLEQLRILEHGWRIAVVVTVHGCIGVDVVSDIERATEFLRTIKHG